MPLSSPSQPIETYVPAWEWGAYLGTEAFGKGIDCCTASWSRPAPNTFPGMAKAAGNYNNAALIKMEAQVNGYVEAVALSPDGWVSEGSGQNLFMVRHGALYTPPINGSNLEGRALLDPEPSVAATHPSSAPMPCYAQPFELNCAWAVTRGSIVQLAKAAGIEVHVQNLPREALYVADELFFTGTATEVMPIRSLDRITIGSGASAGGRGPITELLQKQYQDIIHGRAEDVHGWMAWKS